MEYIINLAIVCWSIVIFGIVGGIIFGKLDKKEEQKRKAAEGTV